MSRVLLFSGATIANLWLMHESAGAAILHVPGPFPGIQAAINAANPGDTILVAGGTYEEPQVVIDKAVSVMGEDANTTIIDGGNSTTMTNVGLVRITAEGGSVTFSGFTLQNAGHFKRVRVGVYASSTTKGTSYLIAHNRIIGSNDPNDEGDYGLLAPFGVESLCFLENEVTQTGSNPILIEYHTGPTDISSNKLDVGIYGSDAIFTLTTAGMDITSPQKRDDNVIDVGTGGPFDADHRATGITFAGAYRNPPYDIDIGSGRFTKVQVMRNTIVRIQAERRGISLWDGAGGDGAAGDISSPMVQGNVLSGIGGAAGSKGIQLLGAVSSAKIVNNQMTGLDIGIHLRNWLSSGPVGAKITASRFRAVNTLVSLDSEAIGTKHHADHVSP